MRSNQITMHLLQCSNDAKGFKLSVERVKCNVERIIESVGAFHSMDVIEKRKHLAIDEFARRLVNFLIMHEPVVTGRAYPHCTTMISFLAAAVKPETSSP